MSQWVHAQSFLELALSIEPHLPGYVDAYFGPTSIREDIEANGTIPLDELVDQAEYLLRAVKGDLDLTDRRREYLTAELIAMKTTLRILQGEKLGYVEEAQLLFGLTPEWTDEKVFEEAHRALDTLYPGTGPFVERRAEHLKKLIVPPDRLEPIISQVAEAFRVRTMDYFRLPDGEACEFVLVKDEPWRAYNWYLGNYQSRVELNTDLPVYASSIPHLLSHEAYPGHHSEAVLKEKLLYREQGHLEHSILLVNTPSCVVCEGIAENALEVILNEEEQSEVLQQVLDASGISEIPASVLVKQRKAGRALSGVRVNAALLLYREGATEEEVVKYGMRYGLLTEGQSRKALAFLLDPLWRTYVCNYAMGYELVHRFLGEEQRIKRFKELLQEPYVTSQLEC